jgi:hypothetical protein
VPGIRLTEAQSHIASLPLDAKSFLSGPAGTGKTTAGVRRLEFLLESGVDGSQILVLTPQRSLQHPYFEVIRSPLRPPGGEIATATLGGLARRFCELFWPLVGEAAGFAFPEQPPTFLTLETSQYYMAYLLRDYLDSGHLAAVTIDRNRLYAQLIDNLNKSAVVGFAYTEIGSRLDAAYQGEPGYRRVYAEAQECASRFRSYCLAHNLLDFSLQVETFLTHVWPQPLVRDYLSRTYLHLIYDNVEEDVPRAHDLVGEWLDSLASALLIYDERAGFRRFLGADPDTGLALAKRCRGRLILNEEHVMSPKISTLATQFLVASRGNTPQQLPAPASQDSSTEPDPALRVLNARFYPELLEKVAASIHDMVFGEKIPAAEIAVVAPYLSDALRFALARRLDKWGVRWYSLRPSRSLRDEPAVRALVALASVAHPHWSMRPLEPDFTLALATCIDGMDLIRAQLLAAIVYRPKELQLSPFTKIRTPVQQRIGDAFGTRYETLREWIQAYRGSMPLPLDHFFRRLFGEVLSQPGFGFHANLDAVRAAAMLVESVHKFRMAMQPDAVGRDEPDFDIGREYLRLLDDGVIASLHTGWAGPSSDAVLVAPAHAFLMINRAVRVQVWMDIGSTGWHERLAQPLTQPHVLSRSWEAGRMWVDSDELLAAEETLLRTVTGLLRRCRDRVLVGISELGEAGYEQRGALLRTMQSLLAVG